MTMIITHADPRSRRRLNVHSWLSPLLGLGHNLHAAWSRRQSLRALEALPAETLKDIGWPTTDSRRMRTPRR